MVTTREWKFITLGVIIFAVGVVLRVFKGQVPYDAGMLIPVGMIVLLFITIIAFIDDTDRKNWVIYSTFLFLGYISVEETLQMLYTVLVFIAFLLVWSLGD